MSDHPQLYRSILGSMDSGVIALDGRGQVMVFNAAAETLLALPAENVVGRRLSEVFVVAEGLDEFTDAILGAVYRSSMSDQRTATVRVDGVERVLSVSTTYLRNVDGCGAGRGSVVAVFNDISEVKELRESEIRLAREGQERRAELEEAHVGLQTRNWELSLALRRLVLARWIATGLVIVLFAGTGLYFWAAESGYESPLAGPSEASDLPESVRTVTVEPRLLRSYVTVRGRLEPLRSLAIGSPFAGFVKKIHFEYGEQVEQGQPLVELDTATIEAQLREARVAYITAEQSHRRLTDPTHNTGVSSARLAVHRARIDLSVAKEELEELRFLRDRGVVSEDRLQAVARTYDNQVITLRSAEANLEIVLQDNETGKLVSELNLASAGGKLEDLERSLARAVVRAPVAGVILRVSAASAAGGSGASSVGGALTVGEAVERGARLLTIGDLTGISILGKADEIDVGSIRAGLPVRVSGDGFQGIALDGTIAHVSSEASRGSSTFELTAQVSELSAAERKVLRIGMSARLDVLVYEKRDALLVPLGAVNAGVDPPTVRVRSPGGGAVRTVEVRTGIATLDSVEILEGLEAGASVLVTGG